MKDIHRSRPRRERMGAADLRSADVLVRVTDSAGNEWHGRRMVERVGVDGNRVIVVLEGSSHSVDLHITDKVTVERRIGFSVVGVLEAGTTYRVGSRDGELRVAPRDVPDVVWVESYGDFDVFEMPDGVRIFVEYAEPAR